jgi:GNAT superfamily N-acetyltransferase
MLRRAGPEDVDAIAGLFERSFGTLTFLPMLHTADEHRAFFGRQVAEHEVTVAERGGAIVGFAVVAANRLDHLYVEPDAIGSGVGHALFADVAARRPDGFELWVFQQNERARRFYERHGCRAVELTDGRGNEERTPDVRYEWRPEAER